MALGGEQFSSHTPRPANSSPPRACCRTRQFLMALSFLQDSCHLAAAEAPAPFPRSSSGTDPVLVASPWALWPHLPLTLLWCSILPPFVASGNLSILSVYLEGEGGFFMSPLCHVVWKSSWFILSLRSTKSLSHFSYDLILRQVPAILYLVIMT